MVSQDFGSGGNFPHRGCGTMQVHHRLLDTDPQYAEARRRIEDQAFRTTIFQSTQRTGCTKLPVVVHVVFNTPEQDISDEQINSQIEVLNQDFRKQNSDISLVPAPFVPLSADARIEYELATQDPEGNPSTGITRTRTDLDGFDSDDGVKFSSQGGVDAWPRDRYLNIWVCQLRGGLLGYAQFPGGAATTDGVVVTHTAFGTTGTAAAPFNKGRTTTHEIGHWLNLRHIWGDDGDGCSGSDFVSDTPNQGGPNFGTPSFPSVSCSNGPNGDMFVNFMDYVDDEAMMMFTEGQVARMHAALDGARNAIGTSIPCNTGTKTLPKDNPKDFTKESPKELPKEFLKELPKDPPKEVFKEFPKDTPKEFSKDGPKDGPFDPPKTVLDPPIDFPFGPTQPFQPTLPGQFGPSVSTPSGQQPFVLATPFNRSDQRAQLAAAYLQLLTQYAQLHAQGQLDSQALNAWQQVWLAYRSLMG